MENLKELVASMEEMPLRITTTNKGAKQIQQTDRNALKARIQAALYNSLKELFEEGVYLYKEGVLLEIPNRAVADAVDPSEDGSGAITVTISATVHGLEYNAELLAEEYEQALAEKEQKAKEQAQKKAEKIARDTKARKGE